jgi:hypothetical protein
VKDLFHVSEANNVCLFRYQSWEDTGISNQILEMYANERFDKWPIEFVLENMPMTYHALRKEIRRQCRIRGIWYNSKRHRAFRREQDALYFVEEREEAERKNAARFE